MNWKKWSPISFVKLMGIFALIVVSGVGVMTVMSLQPEYTSGTATAYLADVNYYRTLYGGSDYEYPLYHDGSPYVLDLINYEGKSLNLTLTPKVLGIDSIYLMRITGLYYLADGRVAEYNTNDGSYMRDPSIDVIKIAVYPLPTNIVPLGIIDVPENDQHDSSWWLVCFCVDMGTRYGSDWNPDGRILIDLMVV